MIILSNYHYPQTDKTDWIKYDGETAEHFTAEEMPVVISDLIDEANNEHVYINDLSLYNSDLLDVLYLKNYKPVQGNPPVRKMKNNSFKYLINGNFNMYSVTTVKKRNETMHFVNANNMLAINNSDTIIKAWTNENDGDTAERLAKGFYRAIKGVLADIGAERRLPVTISGCARRSWNASLEGQIHNLLKNANNVRIGNETLEKYCRRAYHGGLCINNVSDVNIDIDDGIVLDVNSLYPFIMKNYPMPFGEPHYEKGRPSEQMLKDAKGGYVYLYLKIRASFELKKDGIPCVQLSSDNPARFTHKRGWLESSRVYNYFEDEYIESEKHSIVEMTLTQTDFNLFLNNYDIRFLEFIDYVWFPTTTGLFESYVDRYYKGKKTAKTAGDRRVQKMMLNGLSGNMARLPEYENITIVETNEGFEFLYGKSQGSKSYVYVGGAITSYAREYLINHINKCKERWLYSDTDSIHLKGVEIPEGFTIGEELGQWKIEKQFDKAVYYTRKMYSYHDRDGYHFTLAGIPKADTTFYSRILNGMSEEEAIKGLDIKVPSVLEISEAEANAVQAMFEGTTDDGDNELLGRMEKRGNYRSRRAGYIYNVVAKKENPLKAFYFCKLPVTLRHHGKEPFTDGRRTEWKQLSDIKDLY